MLPVNSLLQIALLKPGENDVANRDLINIASLSLFAVLAVDWLAGSQLAPVTQKRHSKQDDRESGG